MREEEYMGQLDEQQLLFREILSVAALGKQCHSDMSFDLGKWTSNVDNFYHAVRQLMVLSIRHLDREFFVTMRRVQEKYKRKWLEYKATNTADEAAKEYGRRLTLQYSDFQLATILKKLDEKGVYNEKSFHATPPGTDEDHFL